MRHRRPSGSLGVPLREVIDALATPTVEELLQVCPQPVLIQLPQRFPVEDLLEVTLPPLNQGSEASMKAVGQRLQAVIRSELAQESWLHFLRLPLGQRKLYLGREPEACDLVLDLPTVSRRHATIAPREVQGISSWVICDLESRFGTTLEQRELSPRATMPLRDGMCVRLARHPMLFLRPKSLWRFVSALAGRTQTLPAITPTPPERPALEQGSTLQSLTRHSFPDAEDTLYLVLLDYDGSSNQPPDPSSETVDDLQLPTHNQAQNYDTPMRSLPARLFHAASRGELGRARLFELTAQPGEDLHLGRDRACELYVDDPTISRRHASFVRSHDGWRLVDQDTRNGTYVDDSQLPPGLLMPVGPAQEVGMGRLSGFVLDPQQVRTLIQRFISAAA